MRGAGATSPGDAHATCNPQYSPGKKEEKKTQKDFSLFRAVIVGKKKESWKKSSTSTVNHRILRCMALLPGGRRLPSNIYQNVKQRRCKECFSSLFFSYLSLILNIRQIRANVYSLVCFSDDCETPKKICVQVRSPEDRHLYRCLNGNSLSKHCAAAKLHSSWCCPYPIHFLDISLSRHTSA